MSSKKRVSRPKPDIHFILTESAAPTENRRREGGDHRWQRLQNVVVRAPRVYERSSSPHRRQGVPANP